MRVTVNTGATARPSTGFVSVTPTVSPVASRVWGSGHGRAEVATRVRAP